MRHIAIGIFSLFCISGLSAQVDYADWNTVLKNTVSPDGIVNYQKIKSEYSTELFRFTDHLEQTDPNGLGDIEKLTFWINAYNAFTVALIVNNYPLKSIRDIDSGDPWKRKWITISGYDPLSLNDIEHEIIRKEFDEPRIHFAVNCAAQSCPPLRNESYLPENLDQQLKSQTVNFINNAKFNEISRTKIRVSRLFDWYKVDFGDVIQYLNRYSSLKINPDASVAYKEYNWDLNN